MDRQTAADRLLGALAAPELEPLFRGPAPAGGDGPWTPHIRFAHWLIHAARPRLLVELGTVDAVSYGAFCDAVRREGLDTACRAVGTWPEAFARHQRAQFAGFSRLLAPDEAAEAGEAIDLLHIDLVDADAAEAAFAAWQPRLSDRAVVLLHNTNRREAGCTVWRLWAGLRARHPGFEFLHGEGLGVLAIGPAAPAAVAALCAADPAVAATLRHRFAVLSALGQHPAIVSRTEAAPLPPAQGAAARGPTRLLFVAGEPHTPGARYRCLRPAEAARAAGLDAAWLPLDLVDEAALRGVDLVVLWRTAWDDQVAGVVAACRGASIPVVFDIDDLVVRPELATLEFFDAIRTLRTTEDEIRAWFGRLRQTMDAADRCLCTTDELAAELRALGKPSFVLPNGFDAELHVRCRQLVRARPAGDGLVRLGYASGSRTHQRDFAVLAAPVAAVLRQRRECRLVVFRDASSGEGVVLLHEFPEFDGLEAQVEWRDMVTLPELPTELVRFDINLAPLQLGNPFTDAKSELKYVEAALLDLCTVASPTGPYRRAIAEGETGFLAATPREWETALLRLVDDAALRRRVGRAAYHDVLWRFGPQRRAEAVLSFLDILQGGRAGARALAQEHAQSVPRECPALPDAMAEVFATDGLGNAEITVAITLRNHAGSVLDALDSVLFQTLAPLDLVVIDDASTDDSLEVAGDWLRTHAGAFNRVSLRQVHGLPGNAGFDAAETPFVLPLAADRRLDQEDCAWLLDALLHGAAFAVAGGFDPLGAFPEAPVLIAKWAWAAVGGTPAEGTAGLCRRIIELGLCPEVRA